MESYLLGVMHTPRTAPTKRTKALHVRPPPCKKPRSASARNTGNDETNEVDATTKKLFTALFDNKNKLNEICGMLFGPVLEANRLLRDFLVARSHITFSEKPVDFLFKKTSPYSCADIVDRFKLRTNAPRRVKIIFQCDATPTKTRGPGSVTHRKKPTGAPTSAGSVDAYTGGPVYCNDDVDVRPHMPDTYNKYNWHSKPWIIVYAQVIVRVLVEFFRKMDESADTVIMVQFVDIGWLADEIFENAEFEADMLKKYNVSFARLKK